MTFKVYFYAEQAFLSFVKKSLINPTTDKDEVVEAGAVCVLACAAALEAMVNSLLKDSGRLRHFDELKLRSKIETIADFGGEIIDWGVQPWQDIAQLIRVRNWLAHYKDPDIGLVNSESEWIKDSVNKAPKIDPDRELSMKVVKNYYDSTRQGLKTLATCLHVDTYLVEFLDTEKYEPFPVG